MAKAYSSITITDLVDTATYIYYSQTNTTTLSSWHKVVTNEDKYIGFYDGPPVDGGQPTNPTQAIFNLMQINKYVGNDGRGISSTVKAYAAGSSGTEAPDSGWQTDIPSVPAGQFLWTRITINYTTGDPTISYSVSRMGVDGTDGEDAGKYRIVTNQEEILKYYENDILKFSPSRLNLHFKISETDTLVTDFTINYSDTNNNQQNIKTLLTTSDNYYLLNIEDLFNEFENLDSTIPGYIYIDWTVDSLHITKTLSLRFMMQDDQAKLALHAGGIVASIQNSKLEFGADGLMIKNGGLEIKNSDEITVFEADSNGNLILNNITANNGIFNGEINATSGTFNGAIYATSGTFNGEVNATSGTFTGEVHATNGTFNGEVNATSGTFTGTINAANGEIGGFQIDATSIYTDNSDVKLDSGTKTLKIGNIVINGINSTINGDIFSITPTQAIFNNIIAKGKISTSIFENAKIQSMGGSMIFRPTYKIIAYTSTTITLETNFQGYTDNDGNFINSYIYIIDDNGNIDSFNKIESINGSTITVATELDSSHNIYYIIDIGPNGSLLLGTNSNTSANRFLLPEGITFSTLNVNSDGQDNFTTNLFLGNLTTLNYSGYGLYGDNVILNGSLTTKSGTNKYAGVNTISQVHFTKGYNDESPIIFWAGSVSDSSADIVNSPFQVTENGTIYASQGVFTGSIISDSIIQGADIYAARLHGGIEGNAAPLTIYDSSQGIVFKEQYNTSQEKETFNIKSDGFYIDTNKFISIGNGIHYFGDTATIGSILLNNNRIYSTNEIDNLIIGPDNNNIIAKFDSNQIEFNAPTLTQINSAKTELKSSDIYFNNEKMYYKEIITNNESIGYDLYV